MKFRGKLVKAKKYPTNEAGLRKAIVDRLKQELVDAGGLFVGVKFPTKKGRNTIAGNLYQVASFLEGHGRDEVGEPLDWELIGFSTKSPDGLGDKLR